MTDQPPYPLLESMVDRICPEYKALCNKHIFDKQQVHLQPVAASRTGDDLISGSGPLQTVATWTLVEGGVNTRRLFRSSYECSKGENVSTFPNQIDMFVPQDTSLNNVAVNSPNPLLLNLHFLSWGRGRNSITRYVLTLTKGLEYVKGKNVTFPTSQPS